VIAPVAGLARPILPVPVSVNQTPPSGPSAIRTEKLLADGIGYSLIAPVGSIAPILLTPPTLSVNQSRPSGPSVMPARPAPELGTGYSEIIAVDAPAVGAPQAATHSAAASAASARLKVEWVVLASVRSCRMVFAPRCRFGSRRAPPLCS
jgi:hypothetical protein